ncbi:MAG: hypothetical protein ACM3ZC_11335 [Bacteroidota bacterium]
MCLAVREGMDMADCILGERIRRLLHWYNRGFLTEIELVHLVGKACLCWAEQVRLPRAEHGLLVESRDAV